MGGSLQNRIGADYLAWKHWAGESFGTFTRNQAAYFEAEVLRRIPPPCSILEIGFGNGSFLAYAKSRGVQVAGTELIGELIERANAHGIEAYSGIPELRRHFDGVVAFDVLEHISHDDLPGFLGQIRDVLKTGGLLIARVPNGDSPFGRINQNGDMTHKTAFGRDKVRQLATIVGMEVLSVGNQANPIRGVGLRTGLLRFVRKAIAGTIEYFVSYLYFNGEHIGMESNYVMVLRKIDTISRLSS